MVGRDVREVPEPELALVLNSRGSIVGHTIGNDMSSRDIEGENVLYLPQAKIYDRSCALGPWLTLARPKRRHVMDHRAANRARRPGGVRRKTSVSQIKRRFDELAVSLFRSQSFLMARSS
jgi:2-dehydro-3-deoxy-D-arabinonate dehydratase